MSQIEIKYAQLKASGLDLGADLHPGTADTSAGYGGTFRQYQNGNIYFHPGVSPEAHEVHGGILSLYLKHGGPGVDPATGQRMLGFPKSDETPLDSAPNSTFEWASIFWTHGTGGVVLTGAAYQAFVAAGSYGFLGLPLTSNIAVAGGQAIYCERGVAWASDSVPSGHLVGNLTPPLLGTPAMLDPTPPPLVFQNAVGAMAEPAAIPGLSGMATPQPFLPDVFQFQAIPRTIYDALIKVQPSVFQMIWANRLSLIDTGARTHRTPLDCVVTSAPPTDPTANVYVTGRLELASTTNLLENTLYDIELTIPNAPGFYPLSPHSVYIKKDWTDFGLLHITDLHLSLRNEQLRARLKALGLDAAAGVPESIGGYANCQDRFRDFIKYANHLRSLGLAHGVIATGDLVDYAGEAGDVADGPGNYRRFRNMILGQPFDAGVAVGEELLLPIFTTFGNHDHRLNPYDLHCKLGVADSTLKSEIEAGVVGGVIGAIFLGGFGAGLLGYFGVKEGEDLTFDLDNYDTFNLEEDEVTKLQGGVPQYGATDYSKPLSFLKVGTEFPYFDKYFGPRNNKVALGSHRLVILDSGGDSGVPEGAALGDLPGLLLNYISGDLSPDTIELASGCPNSVGYTNAQLSILRQALAEAGPTGLVIVGVHLPPLAPTHGYNDYMRETEHPTANPQDIPNYVAATGINGTGWVPNGTPYFKTGNVEPSLGYGIGTGGAQDFLNLCAGIGAPRPIDLLLCGHHHDRVEFRVRWDQAKSQLEYYMDFYTENPVEYFISTTFTAKSKIPGLFGAGFGGGYDANPSHIFVNPGAKLNGEPGKGAGDDVNNKPVSYDTLTVPPYADPLNSSSNAEAWWQNHRPLLIQTAALGPIDPVQRTPGAIPPPTFQGFRLMVIRKDIIQKIHYITDRELLRSNFALSWEAEEVAANKASAISSIGEVIAGPVLATSAVGA